MADTADTEHAEPVVVATLPTVGEAEVVQALLRSAGVESEPDDQVEGGTVPIEGEPGVNVLVRAVDAEQARQALDDTPPQ